MKDLKEKYENIENIVTSSQMVQEVIKGIEFVKMISNETLGKMAVFGFIVAEAMVPVRKRFLYEYNI